MAAGLSVGKQKSMLKIAVTEWQGKASKEEELFSSLASAMIFRPENGLIMDSSVANEFWMSLRGYSV